MFVVNDLEGMEGGDAHTCFELPMEGKWGCEYWF